MLGAVRAVLFAPEDLALVRGDPGERRRYLDELATVRRPLIAGVRADYDKCTALLRRQPRVTRMRRRRCCGKPRRLGRTICRAWRVGWSPA